MRLALIVGAALLGGCSNPPCGDHPKSAEEKFAIQYWSHTDHCWKGWDYFPTEEMASLRLSEIRRYAHSGDIWEEGFIPSEARVVPLAAPLPSEHKDIASPKP